MSSFIIDTIEDEAQDEKRISLQNDNSSSNHLPYSTRFPRYNVEDGLINIGSSDEISISDLVDSMTKIIDYKGEIIFNTKYPDGNPRKLLDSSKILSYGWKPKVKIDEGLSRTYKWYLENISKNN